MLVERAHLNARFGEVDLQGHLLSHEDVRIPSLSEQVLQHVELGPGERRPFSALFARGAWGGGKDEWLLSLRDVFTWSGNLAPNFLNLDHLVQFIINMCILEAKIVVDQSGWPLTRYSALAIFFIQT